MTAAITNAIKRADPRVPDDLIARVLAAHARASAARSRLAEELRDHPVRLTQDDARSSAVLARIAADLKADGHARFVQPTCPSCGRKRTYGYPQQDGSRICRSCRPEPTETCAGCGQDRRVARRLPDGSGLCTTCFSHDTTTFETCAECARLRRVAVRDPQGRPSCHSCYKSRRPDRTGRWSGNAQERRSARTAAVIEITNVAVPGLAPIVIEQALDVAAPSPGGHANVANWLLAHPAALTDGDNRSPPAVLKFIDLLIDAGAGVVRPSCSSCGRPDTPLPHNTPDGRVCPACYLAMNAEPCAGCGVLAPVHRRAADGAPLCQRCARPLRRRITCSSCGRERFRAATVDGRPLCGTCKRHVAELYEDCSICGRSRPVGRRGSLGVPVCPTCAHRLRTEPCFTCGRDRPVATRRDGQPYCATCRPRTPRDCQRCGQRRVCHRVVTPVGERRLGEEFTEYVCGHCLGREGLHRLLEGPAGTVADHWHPLIEMMLESPNASALLEWIRDRATAEVLHALAQQDARPTHADLDSFAVTHLQSAEQARALLEAAGLIDGRDSRWHRLSMRAERRIAADCPLEDRLVVRAYLKWSLLPAWERTARRRKQPIPSRNDSDLAVVIAYLNHLRARGACLTDPHQALFDDWIAQNRSHILPLRRFLRWAERNEHSVPIDVPQVRRRDPKEFIPDEHRRTMITAALWGPGPVWSIADRVAILLVLLYGQSPKRIVSLRREDLVGLPDGRFQLRLGRDPVVLLPPVASLATQLQQGRPGTVPLRDVPSPWLFPGRSPGRHLHPTSLSRRLKALGVPARPGHNSTLLELAQSAPPAVLADLLGLHPSTVEAWSNASAARWACYVAADPPQRT